MSSEMKQQSAHFESLTRGGRSVRVAPCAALDEPLSASG